MHETSNITFKVNTNQVKHVCEHSLFNWWGHIIATQLKESLRDIIHLSSLSFVDDRKVVGKMVRSGTNLQSSSCDKTEKFSRRNSSLEEDELSHKIYILVWVMDIVISPTLVKSSLIGDIDWWEETDLDKSKME